MKSLRFLLPGLVLSLFLPAPARAQIISTMAPAEAGGTAPGGGGRKAAVHVMGGWSNWDFGGLDEAREFLESEGGGITGGQNGFIIAGDFTGRIGRGLSVGGGGWVNTVADQIRDVFLYSPNFPGGYTETISYQLYSFYGNMFYKHVGVQVGVVPFKGTLNIFDPVYLQSYEGDISQTDVNVFGMARMGSGGTRNQSWSATAGAGIYRYGERNLYLLNAPPRSPAATAFTAFANASIFVYKHLSVDMSFWYTGADKNEGTGLGNPSQSRFTIGVGVGR
jgi:hypothetical protein